jgi:hypothetical protein
MSDDPVRISLYSEMATKKELQERADEHDRSLSEHCMTVLRDHLDAERKREIDAESRVEQAMQEIVALGKDELRRTARQIAGMNARMGVYSIANWELLKRGHPDAERRDALSTGSRRLRKSVDAPLADELGVDPDDLDGDLSILDEDPGAPDVGTGADADNGEESIFDMTRDGDERPRADNPGDG